MTNPLPISPRMSYGQMRHVLSTAEPDLHVRSAQLPGKLDGLYCQIGRASCRERV